MPIRFAAYGQTFHPDERNRYMSIGGVGRTLSASSTMPCSMFVHVTCMTVSTLCSCWVMDASSSVRSFVDPPAPHVIEMADGLSSVSRDIRERRLLKP